jgi:hypothetical protein
MLDQYLLDCPACGSASAAHIDATGNAPVLVRFVCARACQVDDQPVLSAVPHRPTQRPA